MYFSELVGNAKINTDANGFWYKLYHLNPVAELCVAYRKLILAPAPIPRGTDPKTQDPIFVQPLPFDWMYLGIAAVSSFLILIAGYALFNRLKWRFVERP